MALLAYADLVVGCEVNWLQLRYYVGLSQVLVHFFS